MFVSYFSSSYFPLIVVVAFTLESVNFTALAVTTTTNHFVCVHFSFRSINHRKTSIKWFLFGLICFCVVGLQTIACVFFIK